MMNSKVYQIPNKQSISIHEKDGIHENLKNLLP